MQSLLLALRQETKQTHAALHKNSILKRCQENQLSINEYIQMLVAFYQPWKELMISLDEVPIKNLKPLLITRHQLLFNDLKVLGVNEKILESTSKKLLSNGESLGVCYVVIGSSMGATILSQNIKASLGNKAVSYLSMSPQEAGWPLLSSFLNSEKNKDYPKACIAASNSFKLIESHLSNAN